MNKKILRVFICLMTIAIFVVPLTHAVQPTETSIEYFRHVEDTVSVEWNLRGNFMAIIKVSERSGSIYNGTDMFGDKLFNFTQWGSAEQNYKLGKAQWHFYMVWIKPTDADSGFRGELNGDASGSTFMEMETYTVSGVLQGFGEFKGQKLMIEMVRIPPDNAQITGFKITN
jgi:hypothetical protein